MCATNRDCSHLHCLWANVFHIRFFCARKNSWEIMRLPSKSILWQSKSTATHIQRQIEVCPSTKNDEVTEENVMKFNHCDGNKFIGRSTNVQRSESIAFFFHFHSFHRCHFLTRRSCSWLFAILSLLLKLLCSQREVISGHKCVRCASFHLCDKFTWWPKCEKRKKGKLQWQETEIAHAVRCIKQWAKKNPKENPNDCKTMKGDVISALWDFLPCCSFFVSLIWVSVCRMRNKCYPIDNSQYSI